MIDKDRNLGLKNDNNNSIHEFIKKKWGILK